MHFIWQQSDDGKQWKQIGEEYNKEYTSVVDPYYSHTVTCVQESKQGRKAKHWRMYGLGGELDGDAYIRTLFITLTL